MKRTLILLVALAILIGGGLALQRRLQAAGGADQNQYRVTKVTRETVKKTVTSTGVLKPWTTVDIKSKAGGRIDTLAVDEGTIVKKGQLIAAIDPSDTLLTFNSAKADIDSNKARVQETERSLELQQRESVASIQTAQASLDAAKATAKASYARLLSARAQSAAQPGLTDSSIASAKANLASEKARLDQMVRASQPQDRASAEAALDQAKANFVNAEAQLRRQKALLAKGYVAQSVVDQAQAAFGVAQAAQTTAQRKVNTLQVQFDTDITAQQARVNQLAAALQTSEANRVNVELQRQSAASAKADYDQALANITQAEARLRQARAERINNAIKLTQIAQARANGARAQASLVNAQTQLDQTRVEAPSAGIVLKKYVEQGTLITSGVSFNSSGTSIVQLGDISRMYVDVQVDETDVASVDLDQKVDITFDAYSTTPFEGKVIKIDPQAVIDQNVTTVHVRVEVDNSVPSYRLLKPGMNATCEFIADAKEDVIAVPNEALKTDDNGDRYVDVVQSGKPAPADKGSEPDPNLLVGIKQRKRVVQIGLEGNDSTEITQGLKEGEQVVTQVIEPVAATPGPGGGPMGGARGVGRR
ncbi:MAG TPA: efflux RND transporter periplasmic adaptor subunit [Armatimonadota bacterium]|jgi:HlyD family secretion protein